MFDAWRILDARCMLAGSWTEAAGSWLMAKPQGKDARGARGQYGDHIAIWPYGSKLWLRSYMAISHCFCGSPGPGLGQP